MNATKPTYETYSTGEHAWTLTFNTGSQTLSTPYSHLRYAQFIEGEQERVELTYDHLMVTITGRQLSKPWGELCGFRLKAVMVRPFTGIEHEIVSQVSTCRIEAIEIRLATEEP